MKMKLGKEQDQSAMRGLYGDGNFWVRGPQIGRGGFGSVFMANLRGPDSEFSLFPPVMAVKSAEMSDSGTLQKEKEILFNLHGGPNIIRCFGEDTTMGDNGSMIYNILLEYAAGGTLASLIKMRGFLPESDVRRHTRSILRGLDHIHSCGYVHCDLKPDNILLVPSSSSSAVRSVPKISDFGLGKRFTTTQRDNKRRKLGDPLPCFLRGTPRYMSPEAVADGVQEPPCDIWALGCVVLEMLTGNPAWAHREKDVNGKRGLLSLIGSGRERPEIPVHLSEGAKDFLRSCFVWNAAYRPTAHMLLNHQFAMAGLDEEEEEDSVEAEKAPSVEEGSLKLEGLESPSDVKADAERDPFISLSSLLEVKLSESDSEILDQEVQSEVISLCPSNEFELCSDVDSDGELDSFLHPSCEGFFLEMDLCEPDSVVENQELQPHDMFPSASNDFESYSDGAFDASLFPRTESFLLNVDLSVSDFQVPDQEVWSEVINLSASNEYEDVIHSSETGYVAIETRGAATVLLCR